ncbi:MICOS complex subunit MIC60 [Helicobacter pylori]|uniref:MICOS complex subunit MIC60 n=1 Tax=Helicobacter pylori TaxID=210 RepID=UPI001E31CB6F|nr:MICOS complex subunit MIC60 [Helicobacter pylori]
MKNILGKHYKGHQIVSAQAAFYGLASALLPESDFYKNKQKFLEFFKVEELLYKCHFKQLGGFITEALLENSRAKIIESNCNKALKVIEKLQKAITITIDRQIDPTIKELQEHHREVCNRLDRSKEKYISNLEKSVSEAIDRFKVGFREEMHEHIDDDIENDELKTIFKHELQKGTEKLRENIKRRSNECKERFIEDIKKDIEQFEERIKDSLIMLERIISIDRGNTDFNFNIDSGINKIGLFASIGGLALLLMAPIVGWFTLFGGLVLGAIGIVKSVWSFFDSDYKKS